MTVEELIELLQKEDPKAQAILHFKRYTPVRTRSRALRPVNQPIACLQTDLYGHAVCLVADQKGDYY